MHRRNGTSYPLGLRLWEIYNRRLISHTSPQERIVTDYQKFFDQPEIELTRIAHYTGLPLEKTAEAAALIRSDRRHTTFSKEQLIDAGVSEKVIALYETLLQEAGENLTVEPDKTAAAASDVSRSSDSSSRSDQLAGATSKLDYKIPETETVQRDLRGLREAVSPLQARIESLTQELAGQQTRAALEIGRRDGRITELQNAYQHLDDLLLREQGSRERLYQELQQLRDRFAQTNRLLHAHSVQLAESEATTGALTQRLGAELRETKRLIRFLDEVQVVGDRLRESRRWIMVNPFAWLASKFTGKPLRGFGHLDRIAEKYRTWRSAHPEIEQLDSAIAALRSPQTHGLSHSLEGDLSAAGEGKVECKPVPPTKPIVFLRSEEVEVSIVIPVFNQIDFTKACLASVQERSGDIPFEVIVVDDCSTDASAETLRQIPGLVYLRNETNLGFIASCNLGAQNARGRYLLFLNNDTVVTQGWMARLRETFDFEAEAGLVGSKLVYPDGRLQEAGGIIWRDGSGWNRGKFQDADKPEYQLSARSGLLLCRQRHDSEGALRNTRRFRLRLCARLLRRYGSRFQGREVKAQSPLPANERGDSL